MAIQQWLQCLAVVCVTQGIQAFVPSAGNSFAYKPLGVSRLTAAADPLQSFRTGKALKVISGLQNFDRDNVAAVVRAATIGGADLVDIACDVELVKLAREVSHLPICVSAVEPHKFIAAVEAGADMVEIGNYDSFYEEGRVFGADEVLALTKLTRELLPDTPLSVTVPHTLALDQQVSLAEQLEEAGADLIQTEGGVCIVPDKSGVEGLMHKAVGTLAASQVISSAVSIPVMAASGISDVTAPLALATGACGVGVGSAVNKLNDPVAMVAAVRRIAEALQGANIPSPLQV